MNQKSNLQQLVRAALLIAMGLILPQAFHSIQNSGAIFLPIHIPVLIGGFILNPYYALCVGMVTPILSSIFTGMPHIPSLYVMILELVSYGMFISLLYNRAKIGVYPSLIGGMLAGRVVSIIGNYLILHILMNRPFSITTVAAGLFIQGIPGIVIQIVFLLIVFSAAFIQGVTGFGFGIILMCFIPSLLGYQVSVAISVLLSLLSSLGIIIGLKGKLDIKKIFITTIFFAIFQIVGTSLLFSFSNNVLKILLGITLIFFAVLFVYTEYGKYKMKSNKINDAIVGGVSGIAGGMLGIGGPPVVFYYHSIFEDKNDYNINMQVTFTIVNIILLGLHIQRGNITIMTIEYSALALIVLFVSTWIGLKVFKKISKSLLTKMTIIFLFVAGIIKLVL